MRPRIFRIYNYISEADVQMFIDLSHQLTMTRSTGGLRKKGTNLGDEISTRTSENAWDTDSRHAKMLKVYALKICRCAFVYDERFSIQKGRLHEFIFLK